MAIIDDLPPAVIAALASLFGLWIGSFLNVVAYRLPIMLDAGWARDAADWAGDAAPVQPTFNLAWPRSHCPNCERPIAAWQNVPVLSYALLLGRCAGCRLPISLRYPLVEGGVAAVFSGIGWHFAETGQWGSMAAWMAFASILVVLAMIDIDTLLLPDVLTLSLLWIGLLGSVAGYLRSPEDALVGATVGYGVMWSVAKGYRIVAGHDGFGGGDAKLVAAVGAWVGWTGVPLMLSVGAVAAAIGFSLPWRGRRRAPARSLAFGPWLAVGAGVSAIWGDAMLDVMWRLPRWW